MTFRVYINESLFGVSDEQVPGLESRILDAVRAGGAFIDMDDAAGLPRRALVTAASSVRIEKVPTVTESSGDYTDEPDLSFIDLEGF